MSISENRFKEYNLPRILPELPRIYNFCLFPLRLCERKFLFMDKKKGEHKVRPYRNINISYCATPIGEK